MGTLSPLLSSLRESKLVLYSYKIETPDIKESRVLGVNAVMDERIPLLRGYLQAKDSPLASKSAEMVAAADRYQFDWRLLPAIAGQESSFGKKIPWDKEGQKPSYNAWGLGVFMGIKCFLFQVGRKELRKLEPVFETAILIKT